MNQDLPQVQSEGIIANQTTNLPSVTAGTSHPAYAGFGKRFVAASIDGLIIFGINIVIRIVFIFINTVLLNNSPQVLFTSLLSSFLSMLTGPVYSVYFIASRGQTLGKMVMGIKVLNFESNEPPDYIHAILRETVGKLLSAFLFLLGYLWMLWDDKKQTWHDKIAGTVVVKV